MQNQRTAIRNCRWNQLNLGKKKNSKIWLKGFDVLMRWLFTGIHEKHAPFNGNTIMLSGNFRNNAFILPKTAMETQQMIGGRFIFRDTRLDKTQTGTAAGSGSTRQKLVASSFVFLVSPCKGTRAHEVMCCTED